YRYEWKAEEARNPPPRTHTTSASARALSPPPRQFTPVKYFSIDRVFRNESLDATHLAEFHHPPPLVADRGLTLGHLTPPLRQFFTKLGISQLRFKPAYNPPPPPSMEVFSYHEGEAPPLGVPEWGGGLWGAPPPPGLPPSPGLKKWVPPPNSGVFRP
ncbi:SYFA ligase, partial [Chloropsis hardwickii]|nr:SYFA ligase [Chloropsis hardwickii]